MLLTWYVRIKVGRGVQLLASVLASDHDAALLTAAQKFARLGIAVPSGARWKAVASKRSR